MEKLKSKNKPAKAGCFEPNTPAQSYKFNGKELDQETGYYYYGARYYDPSTALWLGTDPLKHKYPDIGAYVYCAGNPINRIDLDGREPIIPFVGTAETFIKLLDNSPRGVGKYKGQ